MEIITVIANVFTIIASGIAIWLFSTKRKTISSILKVLLSYAFQVSLSELRGKLDRLNDVNANEEKESAVNISYEIIGQIKGNKRLKKQCGDVLKRIEKFTKKSEKFDEAIKRSLVSELREKIRHINIENIDDLIGG